MSTFFKLVAQLDSELARQGQILNQYTQRVQDIETGHDNPGDLFNLMRELQLERECSREVTERLWQEMKLAAQKNEHANHVCHKHLQRLAHKQAQLNPRWWGFLARDVPAPPSSVGDQSEYGGSLDQKLKPADADMTRDRSAVLRQFERDMVLLAQLFRDVQELVVAQEHNIRRMEQTSSQVVAEVEQANVELDDAKQKAARLRRNKFRALGIGLALALVIVVAVAVPSTLRSRGNTK